MRAGRESPAREVRRNLLALFPAFWLAASAAAGEEPDLKALFRQGTPQSPFIEVVYRYAGAMLEHGRDLRGPLKSGLFLSALDRKKLSPLDGVPPAPAGVRPERRPGARGGPLTGANLLMDENLLRLLFFLRDMPTAEPCAPAAEEALRWFLENAQYPSGLFPWGGCLSWDVAKGAAASGLAEPTHELSRPWLLWDKCFELAPVPSRRFALALWTCHAADREKGILDPSVGARGPAPRDGKESLRHAGFSIRTWAEAHAATGDAVFLEAIAATLWRCEEIFQGSAPGAAPPSRLSLAIDCDGAARKVPEPLRTRLSLHASREDGAFCSLPHSLKDRKGFAIGSQTSGGEGAVGEGGGGDGLRFTPLWDPGAEGETTASVAMMCVSRYENTGNVTYRDLILAAADAYVDSLPEGGCDAWPMTFGHAISLELAAFRISAKSSYLEQATRLGHAAVEMFFGDAALPRASSKSEHYESITGAATLALALVDHHLTVRHITAVRAPANTIDR